MFIDNLCDFFKKINYKQILPVLVAFVVFVFPVSSYAASVQTFDFSVDVHTPVIPESESYGSGSVVLTSTTDINPSLVFDVILPYDVLSSVINDYFVFNLIAHDSSQDLTGVSFSVNVEFYSNTNTLAGTYSGTWSNWESRSVSARFTTQNRISRHINRVRFVCNWNGGQASRYENLMLNIYAVLINSDGTQSIIQAINKQTDDILDVGSGFGGTASNIITGNEGLSGFIDDYTEIEQSMYDKFTENQTAVIGNFSGFSWGSLSTAVDWTSDYLNRIYDNSGDFRTMFMYPILCGIALIFIGRQGLTAYIRSRREK